MNKLTEEKLKELEGRSETQEEVTYAEVEALISAARERERYREV
jgi:hypothetical protein